MKIVKKIGIILIIYLSMSTIFTLNMSKAVDVPGTDGGGASGTSSSSTSVSGSISSIGNGIIPTKGVTKFNNIIKKLLGFLRLMTGLLLIITIAYTGFEMVIETPDGKKKIKEKMVPIVGGVALVFMASSIAAFIVGIFE